MCCVTSRTIRLTLWNTIFAPASKSRHSSLQYTGFIKELELIHRDSEALVRIKSFQMFNSYNIVFIQGLKTIQYPDHAWPNTMKQHMTTAEFKQTRMTPEKLNWRSTFDWCAMMITLDIRWWKTNVLVNVPYNLAPGFWHDRLLHAAAESLLK